MSDKIDFSFAFDLAAKQPDSAQAPELICIHPLEIQPLDGQQSLAVSLRNGKSSVIPNFLAGPLQGLSVFRKLEEQVQQLLPQLGNQISQQQLTESLRSLLAAGLFQSSRSLCASINSGSEAPAQLAASRVFILTCDRLPAAERLVASIFDNADLSQHEALYLLDDSRDSAALQGNRALLDKYQQRSPIPLRYFGPQEKRAYLERLCEQLPGAASNIRFLLDREYWSGQKTYGVSRNWALVLSAGYRCLMLDDDVLCEALYPPYQKD